MHEYRDIHEFHDPCYYCKYKEMLIKVCEKSENPPEQCEMCGGGVGNCYECD